jgi:hypothetical protein
MRDDACVSNGRNRRAGSSVWTWIFPRRGPRGPRRGDLLKRCGYWLRAGEVPQARVEVDPASASRFDEFNAFRARHTHGRQLPVELYVLLKRDGPRGISVWTLPSKAVEATLIGYLSEVDLPAYEAVLDRLASGQAPMAMFTAHREGARRYAAVVEGLPADWGIPQAGQTARPPLA